jgi:dTDP-4-dehydrorhamnose reductase
MPLSQRTKNGPKRRVVILGLGDLGTRLAQTVAEQGLATDCRVSSERTDGLDVAGMTNVLASFDPDLIMQCARLLSPFALLE